MSPRPFSHPMLDFIEGRYACVHTVAPVIYFSEMLSDFVLVAEQAGWEPVVVFCESARWTFAARYLFDAAGVQRVAHAGDEFVNAATGVRGASITEVCERGAADWDEERLVPPDALLAVGLLAGTHPVIGGGRLGRTVESLADSLAGCEMSAWGRFEPAPFAWGRSYCSDYLHRGRRFSQTFVFGGAGRFQAVHTVGRAERETVESVVVCAVIDDLDTPLGEVADRAVEALACAAELLPKRLSGSMCLTPGWKDGSFRTGPAPALVPAAVLAGGASVRAFEEDLLVLAGRHGMSLDGLKALPWVIAGFENASTPWRQAHGLAEAFGVATFSQLTDIAKGQL